MKKITSISNTALIGVWIVCGLWSALLLAWISIIPIDFGYKYWYQLLGTNQVIYKYALQNRHGKQNFSQTGQVEHERLFSEIMYKVHHGGKGLNEIQYYAKDGHKLGYLLTPVEVQHLQDVANILNVMLKASFVALALFILLSIFLIQLKKIPRFKKILLYLVIMILLLLIAIFAIGPEAVFYQMHIWVFPAGHQ